MTNRALVFLTLAGLLAPLAVRAQSAVVAGVVMDTAGFPLELAEVVAMRTKLTVQTNTRGVFVVAKLPKGKELFRVRRVGFQAQVFELDLNPGDTVRIGITLDRDSTQTLPELKVDAPAPLKRSELLQKEVHDRAFRAGAPPSSIIDRKELESTTSSRLFNLLSVHGLQTRVEPKTGKQFVVCPRRNDRPAIFVDGALVDGGPTGGSNRWRGTALAPLIDIENLRPEELEAVEVYRSPAERPPEYNSSGAYCTISIWTRRGS
jgi:hypothetical protein